MRKILISAILLSSIAAAPAAAQRHDRGFVAGPGIERELDQIERQIDRLRDRRLISGREANRLQREADQIDRLHDRFRRDGLTRGEVGQLQHRIERLRSELREERREGREDRRDDRRDRW